MGTISEYISRDYAMEEMHAIVKHYQSPVETGLALCAMIIGAPAADVAPVVHGHWCEDEFDVWCSNCSCASPKDGTGIAYWRKISKYCDNCGAKMDENL